MPTPLPIPQPILNKLRQREGWSETVYLDTLGKPTAGMGHLLIPSEIHIYHEEGVIVGVRIPDDALARWQEDDVRGAYNAAREQAHRLVGSEDARLLLALTPVNFQLGVAWWTIQKKTWSLLVAHQWEAAAFEAANSTWAKQTPVRVKDFQDGIRAMLTNNDHGA